MSKLRFSSIRKTLDNNFNHPFRSCRFESARCYRCQQVRHIASACKSGASGRPSKGRVQNLAVDDQTPDEDEIQSLDDELGIFGLYATNSGSASKVYLVEVEINGESIDMEVDTEKRKWSYRQGRPQRLGEPYCCCAEGRRIGENKQRL